MKKLHLVLAVSLAIFCAACSQKQPATAAAPQARAKNVIIMISDGCGYKHIEAANLYQTGKTPAQRYEWFPLRLAVATWAAGGSYDPEAVWSLFDSVKEGATDSAAAATAMSTGHKTYDSAIGVGEDRQPLKHLMEYAEEAGKATGVVTSVPLSHATPAGFVAHNVNRNSYSEIAQEMILSSKAEVIMGGGHPFYDGNGDMQEAAQYDYVGGEETWRALTSGVAGSGVDADCNGQMDDVWTLIQTREEFQKLAAGPAPKRLIGVPMVAQTLQQRRSGDRSAPPYAVPQIETVPTLTEMTRAALNTLDNDPDGFVLMIEGGDVDWAAHEKTAGRTIEAELAFNEAVDAAITWIEKNGGWGETLLIVTGDHETGYITAPPTADGASFPDKPLVNNGKGIVPGMVFNSNSHTNSLLPLFAKGCGAERFLKFVVGTDPVRGKYVQNTSIAKVCLEAIQ